MTTQQIPEKHRLHLSAASRYSRRAFGTLLTFGVA